MCVVGSHHGSLTSKRHLHAIILAKESAKVVTFHFNTTSSMSTTKDCDITIVTFYYCTYSLRTVMTI